MYLCVTESLLKFINSSKLSSYFETPINFNTTAVAAASGTIEEDAGNIVSKDESNEVRFVFAI